jgi:hypothetical protein
MGMDRFGRCSRTKQLGDLRMAFGFGLLGKGKVRAVGLALTRECRLEIVLA